MNQRQARQQAACTVHRLIDSYLACATDYEHMADSDQRRYLEALAGIKLEMGRRSGEVDDLPNAETNQ